MKAICLGLALFLCLFCAPPTTHADTVYVSTFSEDSILSINSNGSVSTFVGPSNPGLNEPWGLAFDGSGNLYVANYGNNTIEEFNSSGTGAIFANTGLDEPIGLAFDSSGNLYVANAANSTIEEFSADQPVFHLRVL